MTAQIHMHIYRRNMQLYVRGFLYFYLVLFLFKVVILRALDVASNKLR